MSDQGDAGQWRPASHAGPYSEPDEPTGPLPSVSGEDAAAPGFPPVPGRPAAPSAADDDVPTGGFPSVSASAASPQETPPADPPVTSRAARRERAPFEPADPGPADSSAGAAESGSPTSGSPSSAGGSSGSAFSFEAGEPYGSGASSGAEAPPGTGASSASGFGSGSSSGSDASFRPSSAPETSSGSDLSFGSSSGSDPSSASDTSLGSGAAFGSDTSFGSGAFGDSGSGAEATGAFESVPEEEEKTSAFRWPAADEAAPEEERTTTFRRPASDEAAPEEADRPSTGRHAAGGSTPPFGSDAPQVDPYDALDSTYGYEVSDTSFGLGTAPGSDTRESGAGTAGPGPAPPDASPYEKTVSAPYEASAPSPYETTAFDHPGYETQAPAGGPPPDTRQSFEEAPPPRPVRAPGEFAEEAPGAGGRSERPGPGEEHDGDNDFFGSDDHQPMWDKPVAPSGPPPQPGKPSSGNLRLPDWMREENGRGSSGPAPGDDYGYPEEDEGGSKLPLIAGVGVLVVALVVAAGVYFFKKGGDGGSKPAAHVTAPSTGGKSRAPGTKEKPQPQEKALPVFRGAHTRPAGRIVDHRAGLSYPRLGRPWQMQSKNGPMAELGFSAGQYAVTEKAHGEPKRWGRLMSGQVGGADRGAYKGAGSERAAVTEVAQTYEARMYGFRHRRRLLASQPLEAGGHKGWLVAYYLTYHRPGGKATGDIFTVALFDTGKKAPGIVLMSVPNTHRNLWPDVNYVMRSVRVG